MAGTVNQTTTKSDPAKSILIHIRKEEKGGKKKYQFFAISLAVGEICIYNISFRPLAR